MRFFGKPHEYMGCLSYSLWYGLAQSRHMVGPQHFEMKMWVDRLKERRKERGWEKSALRKASWVRYLFCQEHCLLYLKCLPSYCGYPGCQPQDSCFFWSLKCLKPIAGTKRRQPHQSCTASFLLLTSNIVFKVMQVFDCIELIISQKIKTAEL